MTLDEAAEQLYAVFAIYPLRDRIPGCTHCVDAAMEAALRSKPLRLLTGDDVNLYAAKAMTTWGEPGDFKHFLPRLVELVASDRGFFHEYIAYKLDYARWRTWPQAERRAIAQYLLALWRVNLSAYPSPLRGLSAGEWLDWLQAIVPDLTTYLDAWRADTRLPAIRHLAALVEEVVHGANFDQPQGMPTPTGRRETVRVIAWLNDSATKAMLEGAFFGTDDEALSRELSCAVEQLEWLPTLLSAYKA